MINLVCYASENMTIAQEHLVVSSLKYGAGRVFNFGTSDIDPFFREMNKDILSCERGAGYWLWKPYVINKALNDLCDGEILIYCDSGIRVINDLNHIITRMDEDIFMFSNGWPYYDWCKKRVMDIMYPKWIDDWRERKNKPQVQASVIFMKVNKGVRKLMAEWLFWCQLPGFIDDSNDDIHAGFQEHRHDQSILSLLQMREGYKLHWWPAHYAEHLPRGNDRYPILFDHHRKRNNEW